MKPMKQRSYVVETYDKQTNTIVHTMVVENGEYIQSDYEDQMAILNSEPARYRRNIIPLWEDCEKEGDCNCGEDCDCTKYYSAPKGP